MVVPVVTVTDARAMIVPTNDEFVPSVAELPTCQNTLQLWAPFASTIWLADAVISVDATWKMKTEFRLPCPLRVRVPLSPMGPVDL